MSAIQVGVIGASGRVGSEIIAAAQASDEYQVCAGLVASDDPMLGKSIAGLKHPLSAGWEEAYSEAEVLIDFSLPTGTKLALEIARSEKLPIVVGTTGFEGELEDEFQQTAEIVPIVRATNVSVGATAVTEVLGKLAQMLGDSFDVELVEAHHRWKKDAPSGTALTMAEAVAEGKGLNLSEVMIGGREGMVARKNAQEIGIHAVRGRGCCF